MTVTRLSGGRVVDPANGRDEVADLWIEGGRIVADPGRPPDRDLDLSGAVLMAGGIDVHSHLGGGKLDLARLILDDRRVTPSALAAGRRYAEMGYTAAFEPAMVPSNARHTHAELADTPIVDKGCYALLGNDDLFLGLLRDGADPSAIADYVAWTVEATQALAVKAVNPGGINAFRLAGRDLGFDEPGPHYGLAPRAIVRALARAVEALSLPHPLHLHCNDLGLPGNVDTTLATIEAVEGAPLHLAHVQFHSYGAEGPRRFSSGAARIAEALAANPNVSVDVGQVMFGQTVTASADLAAQHRRHAQAHPRRWAALDIECEAGCGVLPLRYRDSSYVNALQWAIGLELFLLIEDPWRVLLSTDHPNGAPFTAYPHLIRLLMDRSFREETLSAINPRAAAASDLAGLEREYSLAEIAIVTRAGPARALGLSDRGHLGPGAVADVAAYRDRPDRQAMFERPLLLLKEGVEVVRDGELVELVWGATHVARPEWDRAIEGPVREHFARYRTLRPESFRVADGEIEEAGGRLVRHPVSR